MAEVILDKVNKKYENGFHAVQDLTTPIQQLEPQVVEVGMLGAPQGGAWPVGQMRRVRGVATPEEG